MSETRSPTAGPGSGGPGDNAIVGSDVRAVLTAVGEVVYEWSIATDQIRWGANALQVLGVETPERIATGRAFAALLDADNLANRADAVLNRSGVDQGAGVSYQVLYSILPGGTGDARRLWIEDIGRWYAGGDGRPARAHGVLRVINERYEREQRLAFLARYDELTGFFNRAHLLATLGDALSNAKRFRTSIGFMIVAIDNFREINEAYGFDVADQVFAAAARRIRAQLREGDDIGRYSGNKLGLILRDCSEEDMAPAAERFHATIRNDVITTEVSSVAVTVSIGAVALPRRGRTVNEAMAHAQEALHAARTAGPGRFSAYVDSPARQARRRSNAALSSELVAAIAEERLALAFQPVVDIATRKAVFHEALLRLRRDNGVLAPAAEFVTLSERLGLVRLLDRFTLGRAIEILAGEPAARLSVNVSAETVGDADWLATLAGAARRGGIVERLLVEITETAIIRNLDEAVRFVGTLHDHGARIALDDFGAGYTSFRNLKGLAVDIVKIDGAFIENLPHSREDQAFVRTLVELARNLGIETVAEWVQDEETVAMLAGWGVDRMQGNMLAPASLDWPWPGTPAAV